MGNGCRIAIYSSSTSDTAWTDLVNPSTTCIGVKVRHYYSTGGQTYQVNAGYDSTWAQTPKKTELRHSYHWYKYNY